MILVTNFDNLRLSTVPKITDVPEAAQIKQGVMVLAIPQPQTKPDQTQEQNQSRISDDRDS